MGFIWLVWTNNFICLWIGFGEKEEQYNDTVQEELKAEVGKAPIGESVVFIKWI